MNKEPELQRLSLGQRLSFAIVRDRPMRMAFKLLVIVAALFLEILLLDVGNGLIFGLSHGQMADVSYRRKQRFKAYFDYRQNPNEKTKADFQEEMRLMHRHEDWKTYLGVGLFFGVNGVWIYFYLREKRPATKNAGAIVAPG